MKITSVNFNQRRLSQNSIHKKATTPANSRNDIPKVGFYNYPNNIHFGVKRFVFEGEQTMEFYKYMEVQSKMTRSEYDKIRKEKPDYIDHAKHDVEKYSTMKTTPLTNAKMAVTIKEHFDMIYGEDNYKILSVGVNPSFIAETMKAIGTDIAYLPINGLGNKKLNIGDKSYKTNLDSSIEKNTKLAFEYISKSGVNSWIKKPLIVLNFCKSEDELKILQKLLVDLNNVPADKIVKYSLGDLIKEMTSCSNFAISSTEANTLIEDMSTYSVDDMSNVPHFNINERVNYNIDDYVETTGRTKAEVFDEFDNYATLSGRSFTLVSIHEALNYLKSKKIRN